MEVKLLHHTPLSIGASAIRQCWDSFDKGGCYPVPTDDLVQADIDLIKRVVKKHKHQSTIEHIFYNFQINSISRACLQELARHRMASFSVKSSRYTLKELKSEDTFILDITDFDNIIYDKEKAEKYIVLTGNDEVDSVSILSLELLRENILNGISNDIAKYSLPESYKTSLYFSINARSLMNFLELRTSKAALWEIRDLAFKIYEVLPEQHKFLYDIEHIEQNKKGKK
jgi:thymidylate synthase (FAD)